MARFYHLAGPMRSVLFWLVASIYSAQLSAQFAPHAGLVPSFTNGATAIASSNVSLAGNLIDGQASTHWQSDAPLPYAYIARSEQNILSMRTDDAATDGDLATSVRIEAGDTYTLTLPVQSQQLTLKLATREQVRCNVIDATGRSLSAQLFTASTNYRIVQLPFTEGLPPGARIELTAEGVDALLFECAAVAAQLYEYAGYLADEPHELGQVVVRSWAGAHGALAAELQVSQDGNRWSTIQMLDPEVLQPYNIILSRPQLVLGVRIRYHVAPRDWAKVSAWELQTYDQYGKYGPPPSGPTVPVQIGEMLGVNGLWGWGHNRYSDGLTAEEGPRRFGRVFAKARNYHNLDWDIHKPGTAANYAGMQAGQGTAAKYWVNWQREYDAWSEAGMQVNPSIRIATFKEVDYANPESDLRAWASDFARHFRDVGTVEIGNEPWTFEASTYKALLRGAVAGFEEGGRSFDVLPCALQAADSSAERSIGLRNYLGARIDEELLNQLDGLNAHAYSFVKTPDGRRVATYPEHPSSSFRELHNLIRWLDANRPTLSIYLTEFGYDTPSSNAMCTHGECVSEAEGAAYTLRSVLIANRLGIKRADYYFYGDTDGPGLFSRSGLVGRPQDGAHEKQVFGELRKLSELLGEFAVTEVIQEDKRGYVYRMADTSGVERIVAWLPTTLDTPAKTNNAVSGRTLVHRFGESTMASDQQLSAWPAIWK